MFIQTILLSSAMANPPITSDDVFSSSLDSITVCDTVREVYIPTGTSSPYKLYFEDIVLGERRDDLFSVIIWQNNLAELETNLNSLYGKRICVFGKTRRYTSNNISEIQMNLEDSSQLTIE